MRKVTLVAKCLIACGFKSNIEDTESRVRFTFEEEFPGDGFDHWNERIDDELSKKYLRRNCKSGSSVNVRNLIADLWNPPRPRI